MIKTHHLFIFHFIQNIKYEVCEEVDDTDIAQIDVSRLKDDW